VRNMLLVGANRLQKNQVTRLRPKVCALEGKRLFIALRLEQ
jgi:hypothetical protein